jgi:hypothetical protein
MAPFKSDDEEEDNLFDEVTRMADRMGLEGEKRYTYIDDHMMNGGYERVQSRDSYARSRQGDDEDESGGGRWFGRTSSRPGQQSGGRERGGRSNSGRGSRDDGDTF